MDLTEAVETLYALAPDEFTASRTKLVAAARAANDRPLATAIGGLRKPSVPAWAVNQLARRRPGDLAHLAELGDRLRQAQASGDGVTLRVLGRERSALVDELAGAAADTAAQAGVSLPAAGDREVRDTLTAALASSGAAGAVSGGRLTRSLSYSGFGEVDVDAATVRATRPVTAPVPHPVAGSAVDTPSAADREAAFAAAGGTRGGRGAAAAA